MTNELRALTDIDRLLHEPSRAVIVAILAALESADFVFLQRETGLTRGNLSTHLTKLEQAGYISIEKTFRGKYPLTLCALTATGREAFSKYRKKLSQFVEQTE
ncbi:MAG: transcriptional regulator [Anaerolineales bacterium]|jgi:DNA-binding transcriptional ArsR family regulator|nr:transcriptional regulator [Anaerolineales bacterium]